MEIFNKLESKQLRKLLRKNSTKAEQILWEELRNKKFLNIKFKRQYGVDRYILDFYCPEFKLSIELDGDVHLEKDAMEYDRLRTGSLKAIGISELRFTNEEVFDNLPGVLEKIKKKSLRAQLKPPP